MSSEPKFAEIYGVGLGCFAKIDIKKGSLILEEKDWQIPAELEAEVMGSSIWIKKMWKFFKDMSETDQVEYMTLTNKCDVEIIDKSLDLKSEIRKIQHEKEEKMLKICCIYMSYDTFKNKSAEAEVQGSSEWIKLLWNSFKKLSNNKQLYYLRHINKCDENLILNLDLKSKINRIQLEKAEKTFKVCCIYISYRVDNGLMIKTSKFKHSCKPSASTRKEPKFQIIADVDIKKGQRITINWCKLSAQNIKNEKNPFISREHFIVSTSTPYHCEECNVKINDQIEHYMHTAGQKCSVEVKPVEDKPIEVKPVEVKPVHEGKKSHACTACDKAFVCMFELNKHFLDDHTLVHKCSLCDSEFVKIATLERHIKEVHGKSLNLCSLCSKTFSKIEDLNAHIASVHERKKPAKAAEIFLKCWSCDKYFARLDNLKRHHRQVHEKISDYKCEICDKSFKQKQGLQAHQTKVHGIVKETIQKSPKRQKVCQDGNSFQCPDCKLSFGILELFEKHKSHLHRFNCWFCNLIFMKDTHLQQHITGKSLSEALMIASTNL